MMELMSATASWQLGEFYTYGWMMVLLWVSADALDPIIVL